MVAFGLPIRAAGFRMCRVRQEVWATGLTRGGLPQSSQPVLRDRVKHTGRAGWLPTPPPLLGGDKSENQLDALWQGRSEADGLGAMRVAPLRLDANWFRTNG